MEKPNIETEIPGPEAKKIVNESKKTFMKMTTAYPSVIKEGKGIKIKDVDENTFYDFSSGVAVLNVGQSHPDVVKAIKNQAEKFTHYGHCDYHYKVANKFAKKLKNNTKNGSNKKIGWGNSGTEANEAAMKLIKNKTGRKRFISFNKAFHGRTHGSLSLTASKSEQQRGFAPTLSGIDHIPYPNPYRNTWNINGYEDPKELTNRVLEYLEEEVFPHAPPQDIAAIFFEPIQGEGGYVVPPDNFFKELKKLADKHGIKLADDEIQMGLGRTGEFWAIDNFGIDPNAIQSAKSLGGGVPIGAVIFDEELGFEETGRHASTFAGNPIACAAGIEVVDIINENLENTKKMGKYLNKRLKELQEKYDIIGDVRGKGLAQATEFVKNRETKDPAPKIRNKITNEAFKKGLILLGCGKSTIRYIPPVNIEEEEIDVAINILDKSIDSVI